jgi:hypothetical protein
MIFQDLVVKTQDTGTVGSRFGYMEYTDKASDRTGVRVEKSESEVLEVQSNGSNTGRHQLRARREEADE